MKGSGHHPRQLQPGGIQQVQPESTPLAGRCLGQRLQVILDEPQLRQAELLSAFTFVVELLGTLTVDQGSTIR